MTNKPYIQASTAACNIPHPHPCEELPPLARKHEGGDNGLTRDSLLAKLEHDDVRKELVRLVNTPV
jgi:hypothetical protein